MEQQRELMRCHPLARAERIAKYYLAHANLCLDILKAVELSRQCRTIALDELLAHHVEVIAENHRNELGIELKWELPIATSRKEKPLCH